MRRLILGLLLVSLNLFAADQNVRLVRLERDWEQLVDKATFSYSQDQLQKSLVTNGRLFVRHISDLNDYFTNLDEAKTALVYRYCSAPFMTQLYFHPADPHGQMPFGPRTFPVDENYQVAKPQHLIAYYLRTSDTYLQVTQIPCE